MLYRFPDALKTSIRACARPNARSSIPLYDLRRRFVATGKPASPSSSTAPQKQPLEKNGYVTPPKWAYPERLLIYNAGTGRTALVGCVKLIPVIFFTFSCLLVAPSYYYDPAAPTWIMPVVIIGSAIPMIIVATATAPYANSVYIRLPPFARRSKEALWKFSRQLPPDTPVDITMMRLSGLPKSTTAKLSQLRILPPRFGRLANLERVRGGELPQRPWWARWINWVATSKDMYYVGDRKSGMKRSMAPGVWENVWKEIQKRS